MKRSEITEELKQLDSPLAQMDTRPPYHVPEHYFERLPSLLADKAILGRIDGAEWNVPGGYFEALPQRLRKRANSATPKRIALWPQLSRVAAAVCIVLFLGVGLLQVRSSNRTAGISSEAALAYLIQDVDAPELEDNADFTNTLWTLANPSVPNDAEAAAIEEYLTENGS